MKDILEIALFCKVVLSIHRTHYSSWHTHFTKTLMQLLEWSFT